MLPLLTLLFITWSFEKYGDVRPFKLGSSQGSKEAQLHAAFNYVFSCHWQFLDLSDSTLGLQIVAKGFFVRGLHSLDDSIFTIQIQSYSPRHT